MNSHGRARGNATSMPPQASTNPVALNSSPTTAGGRHVYAGIFESGPHPGTLSVLSTGAHGWGERPFDVGRGLQPGD